LRIRIEKGFWTSIFGLTLLGVVFAIFITWVSIVTYFYVKYSRMIEARLSGHVLQNTTQIFSAPMRIADGEVWSAQELATYLTKVGYRPEKDDNALGQYTLQPNAVDIRPSKLSYFAGSNAIAVTFGGKTIKAIRPLGGGADLGTADIEPELVTNLFDSAREKRRPVRYDDLPPTLVHAIISAEDKRYFEHGGFDLVRIVGAAWADIRHSSNHYQGASTITMQVARTFFFSNERTWRRKLAELMVAMELEQRFNKQQIFELYANEIYLGNRGSFAIHGFAEGSLAYFNKDIRDISLNEAAFLAGIIRAPNRYSTADARPERAAEARDRVLTQMQENGFIKPEQVKEAKAAPLALVTGGQNNNDAP